MSAAAIVAVIHDIIFTVGVYALFHFEVTPATITAFLTILGFSLYDTVVVFDKVRENQRALTATGRTTYGEMVNRSLNQVLMRSLSTSFVALMPVLSLLDRRLRDLRRDRRSRTSPSRSPPGCSSARTRRSSSPRRSWRGGRSASRSTARSPSDAPAAARPRRRSRRAERRRRDRRRCPRHDRSRRTAASPSPTTTPRPSTSTKSAPRLGVPGPPAVGPHDPAPAAPATPPQAQVEPSRRVRQARTGRDVARPIEGSRSEPHEHGCSLEVWLTPPRCGSSCATSPTGPSRGSSSATSRRCWPHPMRSRLTVDALAAPFADEQIDKVIGIEARGFVFAAPVAYRRGAGFVPVRKAGQAAVGDRARGVRARVRHRPPRDPPRRRAPRRAGADRRRRDRDRRDRGRHGAARRAARRDRRRLRVPARAGRARRPRPARGHRECTRCCTYE